VSFSNPAVSFTSLCSLHQSFLFFFSHSFCLQLLSVFAHRQTNRVRAPLCSDNALSPLFRRLILNTCAPPPRLPLPSPPCRCRALWPFTLLLSWFPVMPFLFRCLDFWLAPFNAPRRCAVWPTVLLRPFDSLTSLVELDNLTLRHFSFPLSAFDG